MSELFSSSVGFLTPVIVILIIGLLVLFVWVIVLSRRTSRMSAGLEAQRQMLVEVHRFLRSHSGALRRTIVSNNIPPSKKRSAPPKTEFYTPNFQSADRTAIQQPLQTPSWEIEAKRQSAPPNAVQNNVAPPKQSVGASGDSDAKRQALDALYGTNKEQPSARPRNDSVRASAQPRKGETLRGARQRNITETQNRFEVPQSRADVRRRQRDLDRQPQDFSSYDRPRVQQHMIDATYARSMTNNKRENVEDYSVRGESVSSVYHVPPKPHRRTDTAPAEKEPSPEVSTRNAPIASADSETSAASSVNGAAEMSVQSRSASVAPSTPPQKISNRNSGGKRGKHAR